MSDLYPIIPNFLEEERIRKRKEEDFDNGLLQGKLGFQKPMVIDFTKPITLVPTAFDRGYELGEHFRTRDVEERNKQEMSYLLKPLNLEVSNPSPVILKNQVDDFWEKQRKEEADRMKTSTRDWMIDLEKKRL